MNKEKALSITGGVSGTASVLGSWQVCHNICLGIVTLLSLVGITIVGMPLLFLTKLAIPFWILAVLILVILVIFSLKHKCISYNLLMFNSGLIIAGIPFEPLQKFSMLFWSIGGVLVLIAIVLFIKEKVRMKK